jgi:hypothetical protein
MKKLYIPLIALILAVAMIVPAGVANADSTVEISGHYVLTATGADMSKIVGAKGVMMGWVSHHATYTGSFVGSGDETLDVRVNLNSLAVNSEGIQNFTGTVLGKTGTFTARVGHQSLGAVDFKVEMTILSGTDELANLHGTLVFLVSATGVGVWEGTYSGKVHFDP